jgi:hypothetical protein
VLERSYKTISNCLDNVSRATSQLERLRFSFSEQGREKDFMAHTIQSLKLDLTKMTEYDQNLTEENLELVKRLGMFEDENRNLSNHARQVEELKERAEHRSDELQRKLKEAVAKAEELGLERAELSSKSKSFESQLEQIKEQKRKATEVASLDEEEKIQEYKKEAAILEIELEKSRNIIQKNTTLLVKLESDVKLAKTDAENSKQQELTSKEELLILKARADQLEAQRKKYFNDLGTSKLGLSSLNFSKFFGGEGQLATVQEEPDMESLQNSKEGTTQQIPANLGSFGFDIPPKIMVSKPFGEIKHQTPQAPPVDFLGRHQTPEFHFDNDAMDTNTNPYIDRLSAANPYMDRVSAANPYMDRMSSARPKDFGSILRVRESRVSVMLNKFTGIRDEFDDKQDFIGLSSVDKIKEELLRFGDTTLALGRCYSDSVFLFDKNLQKNRAYVLVTQHSISFFNMKKNKLIKLYLLKSLKGITISAENFTLAVFQFDKQADLLFESYRRLELISYINQMFQQARLPKFSLVVRKRFVIKTEQNQQIPEKLEVSNPNKAMNMPFLQEAIRNSKKTGYMLKATKGWFFASSSTIEYFCLLSNIGIVYFKKYGVS